LPRSSWRDYDSALVSSGGGVYSRMDIDRVGSTYPGAHQHETDPAFQAEGGVVYKIGDNAGGAPLLSSNLHQAPEYDTKLRHAPGVRRLIICSVGIFVCYFYYGIVQEKITKSKYGEEKEIFTFTQALVFVQCLVNAAFAAAVIFTTKPGYDDTPTEMYAFCAFSYLAAMISSNHALQFVPYPTQVLGKSCKPIPIMIFGVLLARKRYTLSKYLCVLLIVLGVSLFLYKDGKQSPTKSHFDFGIGELLLLFSLAMDGTTGAIQEKIRANHTSRSHQMMLYMNLWSTLYLFIGLLVTGEILSFFFFVQKYPAIMFDMVSFSFASALGQYFIFITVTEFGPLTCSVITTTRKFFTILASVLWFQNPLNERQWMGTMLVFAGLTLDSIFSKSAKKAKT